MEPIEIIVIISSALIVLGVIVGNIIRRKKYKKSGKSGCYGCCGSCSGCSYSLNKEQEK